MVEQELIDILKNKYDITFKNQDLLEEALTHSSYANEHREMGVKDYERLEFLGDAVMEINVSDYIFRNYPDLPEGQLTRLRSSIVCTASFSQFDREVGLQKFIRLGNGEEKDGARERDTLLEDVFESFNGALYLDQGNDKVVEFLKKVVYPHIDSGEFTDDNDYKTELQEELQKNGDVNIDYEVLKEEGSDEDTEFTVQLVVNNHKLAIGSGHSKKSADQEAAKKQLDIMKKK